MPSSAPRRRPSSGWGLPDVRLKSLTLKGFKSFPDRTRLDFGPGVSVVVGPNGSGKSNVTDAVLWAMGEQSPLAVRGQSMQDVIFGGGRGVQARNAAEVEIVLDNADGTVDLPVSEISIVRHLDRSGEGEYRLNGARCRLVDVIEVLSDTGLGKETHSVISQGRVEAIVTSKPRDRRLLIEEAAGLGKHRKRRRRAQLKLERTQENLDRALDVEREARTRLRPLKRQAEAAEQHERLERQMLQARLTLAREALRASDVELAHAQAQAQAARAARGEVEAQLQATIAHRGEAERALAERAERHDALARRVFDARAAAERMQLRGEQAQASSERLTARAARIERELGAPGQQEDDTPDLSEGGAPSDDARAPSAPSNDAREDARAREEADSRDRIAELQEELDELQEEQEQAIERELQGLADELEQAQTSARDAEQQVVQARTARAAADTQAEGARERLRAAEREIEAARREAARVGAELAAVNQFLRSHAGSVAAHAARAGEDAPRVLSDTLQVKSGYELALAAALAGRLDALLAESLGEAERLLDGAGRDGGAALLMDGAAAADATEAATPAPMFGAERLSELVSGPEPALALSQRLLADTWVVERLEDLPHDFAGTAVTRAGRVWFARAGELRQLAAGGAEQVLARRNEREQLIAASETAVQAEHAARAQLQRESEQARTAESARVAADAALRTAERAHSEAVEEQRRLAWLIEQRRNEPEQGPLAVRRAQLEGELAAEQRQVERVARERAEHARRIEGLRAQLAADRALLPLAQRLAVSLATLGEQLAGRAHEAEQELQSDRATGEELSGRLRECAAQEATLQADLRAQGEAVTGAEVAAQRLRDRFAEAEAELQEVRERLGEAEVGVVGAPEADAVETDAAEHDGVEPDAAEPDGAEPDAPEAGAAEPASEKRSEEESLRQVEPDLEPLGEEEQQALRAQLQRLQRRREQLGPVNPLAQEEYGQALEYVQELESRRVDLETALRELRGVIRDTDRQIQQTFQETFTAAARNFEELVGDVFPGGSGRLRLVRDEPTPRPVLGGQSLVDGAAGQNGAAASNGRADSAEAEALADAHAEAAAEAEAEREELAGEELLGVEIEITPAGKSTKRLSLLSGGEKSMTALAFLFAVFLARPCPFYILDEVEAALDDLNLDRFLALLRRYAGRAQFIVITHQKRTMEAADWLYGVSMGGDGVSKILSRRLPPAEVAGGAAEHGEQRAEDETATTAVAEEALVADEESSPSAGQPLAARAA
jgi:chromosome segregation protein